jgi:hypothetical protein
MKNPETLHKHIQIISYLILNDEFAFGEKVSKNGKNGARISGVQALTSYVRVTLVVAMVPRSFILSYV